MPDVTGLTAGRRRRASREAGLNVSLAREAPRDRAGGHGRRARRRPAGRTWTRERPVTIFVSNGRVEEVPDVDRARPSGPSRELDRAGFDARACSTRATDRARPRTASCSRSRRRGRRRSAARASTVDDHGRCAHDPSRRRHRGAGALNVVVLAGGRSSEHDVSLESASVGARRARARRPRARPVVIDARGDGGRRPSRRTAAAARRSLVVARRGAARRGRGVPGAARAVRRGRHGPGLARVHRRPVRRRGGAGLGAVHGQGWRSSG